MKKILIVGGKSKIAINFYSTGTIIDFSGGTYLIRRNNVR